MKKGILAFLLFCTAGTFAQKQQVTLDRVVAVVGGSSILHSEVSDYARALVAQRRQEGYTSDRDPRFRSMREKSRCGSSRRFSR